MRRLGRGLRDLFGGADEASVVTLQVGEITPNPYQPRSDVEEGLEDLIKSIRKDGLLQPIVVRPYGEGYQIVFGERRWRAAIKAGLQTIPAIIRDVDEEDLFRYALIENMQRRDLNPIAKARAIKRYMERHGYTQAEVAEKLGVSRSYIANTLRLLALPADIKLRIERGELPPTAAREFIPRQTATRKKTRKHKSDAIKAMESELQRLSPWKLRIDGDTTGGRVVIQYEGEEELIAIFEALKGAFRQMNV